MGFVEILADLSGVEDDGEVVGIRWKCLDVSVSWRGNTIARQKLSTCLGYLLKEWPTPYEKL